MRDRLLQPPENDIDKCVCINLMFDQLICNAKYQWKMLKMTLTSLKYVSIIYSACLYTSLFSWCCNCSNKVKAPISSNIYFSRPWIKTNIWKPPSTAIELWLELKKTIIHTNENFSKMPRLSAYEKRFFKPERMTRTHRGSFEAMSAQNGSRILTVSKR